LTNLPEDVVWNVMLNIENGIIGVSTGLMAYTHYQGNYYIGSYEEINSKLPDLVEVILAFGLLNNLTEHKSFITYHYGVAGHLTVDSMLRKNSGSFKIEYIKRPNTNKLDFIHSIQSDLQSGKWHFLKNNKSLGNIINQLTNYPHVENDKTAMSLALIHEFVSNHQ